MERFDQKKIRRETETGYLISIALLNLLLVSMLAGFVWLLYFLATNLQSFGFFVRESSMR